jgi:hypothetical protein
MKHAAGQGLGERVARAATTHTPTRTRRRRRRRRRALLLLRSLLEACRQYRQ